MRNFKSLDDKIDFFEQGFKKYCFSLGADSISIKEIPDYSYNYSELAIRSYIKLRERYDFGIGLARGGLWHSYIFHTLGLPTFIVQTKRKRSSIVWRPLHDISSPDLLNKRILVLEDDSQTGRTLDKAASEIAKLQPVYTDVLFVHDGFIPEFFRKKYSLHDFPSNVDDDEILLSFLTKNLKNEQK